jgi:hypothetical protein
MIITFAHKAQCQSEPQNNVIENLDGEIFKLFPTKNIWTFLKLDTRNGKIWQVHITVEKDEVRGELDVNEIPLVVPSKERAGRFMLYPTENIYNFVLIDQIDGKLYQVQWSQEAKNRGIIPIN